MARITKDSAPQVSLQRRFSRLPRNRRDFDAFWKKALDEASQNDLNPTKVLLPERCTKDKNVYEISYNNNRWGSKMYGILSVPVKEGKYPALLRVPGAGVRPYAGDTYTAPAECIVLEIGIHGSSCYHGAEGV